MKVSVIMGVYNVTDKKVAEAAITSILNQTFKDFEFIICDDGSDNNTLQMLKTIVGNDPRVKYIKNAKNRGLAYSLNHCLKKAKGKYIARMDIDDISYLNRFEKQVEFLDSHPEVALISSWADLFDKHVWGLRKYVRMPGKGDFLFGTPLLHPALMMRREALLEVGGYTVAWYTRRAEDYDLFVRLYASGHKMESFQYPLYKIREDKNAYKRRSYKYRVAECVVRYKSYKLLGLFPKGYLYVIKPLIVGLIPQSLLRKLRKEDI